MSTSSSTMSPLSCVDYSQTAEDHQSLLVLVRHTGVRLKQQGFARAWERMKRLNCIHIQNQNRNIYVRYKRGYPKENNEWGDFQAHRKVLGLISVGYCSNHKEFEDLFDHYKRVKEEYANTIFNSRLVVFGMNTDGSPLVEEESKIGDNEESKDVEEKTVVDNKDENEGRTSPNNNLKTDPLSTNGEKDTSEKGQKEKPLPNVKRQHSNSLTKESTGAEVVFYPDLEHSADLEDRLKEFITSLFYVLEGKRLDRSFERADRLHLLCAPFEKKDYVGVDQETKSFKKKCMGRLRKHLADLCLQAAMPGEAILHYQTAMDMLRSVNDFLWIGGCYEGLSSASTILTYPRNGGNTVPLRRNQSFSVKRGAALINDSIPSKSSTYANGLDLADATAQGGLHPDDIIEKYKDAIMNYSKYKNASMIEMEASFKACRVLIMQRKYLQASDFLQNVVYINLQSSEEDKIHRYGTLASLYTQVGFHRKAAFFKRVAGMQCVAPGTSVGWHQCYYLLVQALAGYSISLDPKEFLTDHPNGWPVIQYRILHELVYSARRMGNPQLAVRHMTFLLYTMHDKLSVSERRDAISGLETLTAKCEGTPHPLPLENCQILPPVPLLNFPIVRFFKVVPPVPHLHPQKLSTDCDKSSKSGVFIYTPLSLDSDKDAKTNKCDFLWVEGDMCEVHLQVFNPLPEELKINYMGLLTEGVEMEIFPANPSVPAESGPAFIKLYGKPKSVGQLSILGYSTLVLGVRSNCRLKDLAQIPQPHFDVDVVPGLPQVSLSSSLPKAASFTSVGDGANVVASATALLYAGQSLECLVTLQNGSCLPVERLDVSLDTKLEHDLEERIFSWSDDNINSQLPLQPANQLCFSVCIYGYSDFLSSDLQTHDMPSPVYSNRSRSDSSEGKAVEAVLSVQYSGNPGLEAGYCRQCSLALTIDIVPSLQIANWDVQPAYSREHCVILFDIQNVTSHQLDLEYQDGKTIITEPQQCRRIAVEIPRVDFPPEETRHDASPCMPSVYRQCRPVNHYSQYLADYVDIRWTIPATKVSGKLGIEHLTWSKNQLELIQKSPVMWEVRLNDQLYLSPDVPKFSLSDVLDVQVALTNRRGGEQVQVMLEIEPVQVCGDEVTACHEVSVLGVNTLCVSQLPHSASLQHSCAFVFHSPGFYRLNVLCYTFIQTSAEAPRQMSDVSSVSVSDRQMSSDSADIPSEESQTSVNNSETDDKLTSEVDSAADRLLSANTNQTQVIWKCEPVPQFQIID
ncbi:trafficking protein particle complex subunit 9-like [Haliotis cracherodii]|uniref:trafficking protein particle complex subunit 9-like n=1 Tax=Haliotis cracherodii TaxID=6455 RepID=UPI0039ED4DB4